MTKNKVEKGGMFLARKKHHTKHHNHHAFHHKLTTFLPSKNTRKSRNPRKTTLFPHRNIFFSRQNIFSPRQDPTSPLRHQSRLEGTGTPHAASEVVLPYRAPQT
jgi:hypothetical protein